ncbi:hypothetical protein [Flammeovirga sp. OC4]
MSNNNTGSRWESNHADNQWITVDLGQMYDRRSFDNISIQKTLQFM